MSSSAIACKKRRTTSPGDVGRAEDPEPFAACSTGIDIVTSLATRTGVLVGQRRPADIQALPVHAARGSKGPEVMKPNQVRAIGVAVAIAAVVGTAVGVTASVAATSSKASAGLALCVGKHRVVTYPAHGRCPARATQVTAASQSEVASLRKQVTRLTKRVTALEATLQGVTRTHPHGMPVLTIAGENVQIVNGTGDETSVNGLGNLILGYNDNPDALERTGSHNVIVGDDNGYTSYGGIVAGYGNLISGIYASASGGFGNSATGDYSSVSGGIDNTAGGKYATVIGGDNNTATGVEASVTGGVLNSAIGSGSSIVGGYDGTVSTNDCASIPANPNTSSQCSQ
jgi:hypothetical protein